jgi:chromate transporter
MIEVFWTFLKLGLVSFGGPVAHLGYFREAFVERLRWLDDRAYADLVALCQFLPGPASSQVGFAIGLHRAGLGGGIAAFAGFTLPSAVLMTGLALGLVTFGAEPSPGLIHGLKLVAVAVVAHAVWAMARSLTPDVPRAGLAVMGFAVLVFLPMAVEFDRALGQLAVIALAALAGAALFRGLAEGREPISAGIRLPRAVPILAAVLFVLVVGGLPFLANSGAGFALADTMARSGTLVFGGGHVVLPLIEAEVVPPGFVSEDAFLAGYGAAQALPGPLFSFAAYVGGLFDAGQGPMGLSGSLLALGMIFLPGFLLVLIVLPYWGWLRARPLAAGALAGVNAGVVGILAAALYDPIVTSSVTGPVTALWALAGFVALAWARVPAWALVIGSGAAGAFLL